MTKLSIITAMAMPPNDSCGVSEPAGQCDDMGHDLGYLEKARQKLPSGHSCTHGKREGRGLAERRTGEVRCTQPSRVGLRER